MEYYLFNGYEELDGYTYPNKKYAVIAHMTDNNGKILLQRRGIMSRDEIGLYEDIGGKCEEYDESFLNSLQREIIEEAGSGVRIDIRNPIGVYHCLKGGVDWVFVVFDCRYLSGEFKIMEPSKCTGYSFFEYDDAINSSEVSESCKYLIRSIRMNNNI